MAGLEMEFVRKDNGHIIMVNTWDQWFGFQRVSIQGRECQIQIVINLTMYKEMIIW